MIVRKPVYTWYCSVHQCTEVYYVSLRNAELRMCAFRPHMTPCEYVKIFDQVLAARCGNPAKK